MIEKRKLRSLVVLVCVLAICAMTVVSLWNCRASCMGIRVRSDITQELEYSYADYSEYLLFNGEKAAVDIGSSTIYIPQKTEGVADHWQLEGKLQVNISGCQAYFAEDPAFTDFTSAVREGHTFSLCVVNRENQYMEYKVVFTTLPVLRLDGEYCYTDADSGRDVMQGTVTVWSPEDPGLGEVYSTKSGATQWHIRGNSTARMNKTPWKLSLKKSNGENRNESFLGLDSDDDWILNSMVLDDTKIKEQFLMSLWNQIAEGSEWNYKMSTGRYVEVVTNGTYFGLFLLQRRVDDKYLELSENDVLIKGLKPEGYEIKASPYDEETTYALLQDALNEQEITKISVENFVDINLFLQFAVAVDNANHYNMYYVIRGENGSYSLSFIPWDVDLSFGVYWKDMVVGFVYDYDTVSWNINRNELHLMESRYPDLGERMRLRWYQLRENVLSAENINVILADLQNELETSGAHKRDQNLWGIYYNGADSVDNLRRFVNERLSIMDKVHAES